MKIKYSLWRLIAAVVVVLVLGFLCYGFFIWRNAARNAPQQAAVEKHSVLDNPRAFVEQQVAVGADAMDAANCLQLATLGRDVESFRAGAAAASNTKTMIALPAVAPGALQDLAKGQISARFPYLWPYVMAGCSTVIGNALGDEPVVAFYNPYFDVALLTKWTFKDPGQTAAKPGFVMIQAIPMTGRAFLENRASRSTDYPVWSDSKELFELRFLHATQNFVKVFEERYPAFARGSVVFSAGVDSIATAIDVSESRVFYLLRWVIDAQNSSAPVNYKSGIDQFRDALSASSPGKLSALLPADNPQNAQTFFQLPADVRKGMKPYLVIGENVIFLNPLDHPTAFIAVYFRPAAHGYVPALAGLFNLNSGAPAG
jgi:hypothetical protein